MEPPIGYSTSLPEIEKRLRAATTLSDYNDIDPSLSNDLWWLIDAIKTYRALVDDAIRAQDKTVEAYKSLVAAIKKTCREIGQRCPP